jgi:predicted exporter
MASNMAAGKVMLQRIKAAVARADPAKHGVEVRYAGGLVVNQEQHSRMTSDLKRASGIALVAILLLITLYVRRVAAPVVLALPLVIGVGTTLAITALTIGKLNLISGFLVSALLGIGIDFEIHLYLRYLELLAGAPTRAEAMRQAMVRTLPACATAAATTAAAFFAMMISDFRGFREFGLIAGMGVVVTLLTTFIALPPIALALGRKARAPRPRPRHVGFSLRLAWLMVVAGGLTLVASIYWGRRVAWHNDFRKLRGISATVDFSEWVSSLANGSLSPAAIMVGDLKQARAVGRYLDGLVEDPKSGVKKYISLASLVPTGVERKLPILRQIERRMREVLDRVKLTEADRKRVQEALELSRARPWGVAEIPEVFRRLFLTADGKDQFVVVWPRSEMYIDDEIIAWGDELNRIRAELRARGLPVKILDENRLGARVLKKMWSDAPWVILSGSVAVVLILFIHFRSPLRVLRVSGSLAVAMGYLGGALYLAEVDFNVFNLAVVPTIIGLGIDNAVHIYHRYLDEGRGSLAHVVSTTGSASFLATATTAIGFGAAVTAQHMGIRSLGWLTIIGLTCAFVSSSILYPSVLRVFEGRTKQGE